MKILQNKHLRAFNALYKEWMHYSHEQCSMAGLSDSAFDILYVMSEFEDGCSQKTIVEHSWLSKQTVNSSIKSLEKKGWLKVEKNGGRKTRIYLLDEGKKIVDQYILPCIEHENHIFELMGEEDADQLLDLTQRYVQLLKRKEESVYEN